MVGSPLVVCWECSTRQIFDGDVTGWRLANKWARGHAEREHHEVRVLRAIEVVTFRPTELGVQEHGTLRHVLP